MAAASILPFGAVAAAAIADLLKSYETAAQVDEAQQDTKALLGFNASGIRGTAASYGMRPVEAESFLQGVAGSGLNPQLFKQGGYALPKLALALRRGMGVDAGTTADFFSQFKAGAASGLNAGEIQTQTLIALKSARAAGLEAADTPRWLKTIADRTTQLAERGIRVDPTSASVMAETIGRLTGAAGHRRLTLGQGMEDSLAAIGRGEGGGLKAYLGYQAAAAGGARDLYGLQRSLEDPNRSPELTARVVDQVKKLPGSNAYKALVLHRHFGFSYREADQALRGTSSAAGSQQAVSDVGGVLKSLQERAAQATGGITRAQAGWALEDVALGYKAAPTLTSLKDKTKDLRLGAANLALKGAEFVNEHWDKFQWAVSGIISAVGSVVQSKKANKGKLGSGSSGQGTSADGVVTSTSSAQGTGSSGGGLILIDLSDDARRLLRVLDGQAIAFGGG